MENAEPEREETEKEQDQDKGDAVSTPPVSPDVESQEHPESEPDENLPPRKIERKTNLNQTLRKILFWAVGLIVVFGAGALLVFMVSYRPAVAERDALKTELETTTQKLEDKVQELAGLTDRHEKVSAALKKTQAQIAFLKVKNDVNETRLALKNKDVKGAAEALNNARAEMHILLPAIQEIDADLSQLIDSRLTVVTTGLSRDADQAGKDLELLYKSLKELEARLFE